MDSGPVRAVQPEPGGLIAFLRRHSLIIGLALMYLFTWTVHLSAAGILPLRLPRFVHPFANSGFALASILMTWVTFGPRAVLDLLKRFLLWRLGWKWYASLLIIPGTYLLGLGLHALVTGTAPDFAATRGYAAGIKRLARGDLQKECPGSS